jgi:hypothetical protein
MINEATSDEEVIELWNKMLNRLPPSTADNVTIEVHRAVGMRVVTAAQNTHGDE